MDTNEILGFVLSGLAMVVLTIAVGKHWIVSRREYDAAIMKDWQEEYHASHTVVAALQDQIETQKTRLRDLKPKTAPAPLEAMCEFCGTKRIEGFDNCSRCGGPPRRKK